MAWDPTIIEVDPEKKALFACHSSDYLVEALDVRSKRVVRGFNRKYPRVPHVELDWERDWHNKYGLPKREFEPDIRGLHANGSELWVETSTDSKVKGRLIDVFDAEGRFFDSFYLGPGRTLLRAQGDALFALEKNADETLRIVKYAIK